MFADDDMIPLPCNPDSISIGYGLRDGAKVIPLTSLVPREALLPAVPNAIIFEKYPELRERFFDLLSLSTAGRQHGGAAGLAAVLPAARCRCRQGSGYENVFRVTIVEFLDRFNFCLGNVKRSCVHFVTPEGRHHSVRHLQHLLSSQARPGTRGSRRRCAVSDPSTGCRPPPRGPPPPPAAERPRARLVLRDIGQSIVLVLTLGCMLAVTDGNLTGEMSGVAHPVCGSPTLILGGFLWLGIAPPEALSRLTDSPFDGAADAYSQATAASRDAAPASGRSTCRPRSCG